MRAFIVPLCAALALSGCVESSTIECADGRLCPADRVCDLIGGSCVEPGGLVIRGDLIELGTISCGTSTIMPISIGNFSDEPISFEASSTLNILSISPASGIVEAGGQLEVDLTIDVTGSSAVGSIEGAIYFTTSAEVIPRIVTATIEGGIATASVSALDFGIAALDLLPDPREIAISNRGNTAVTMSLMAPPAPFAIATAGPISLEPDATEIIDVSFSPGFTGAYSGGLELAFSGAICQPPPTRIALSGQISDAGLLVDTTIADFGTTPCAVGAQTLPVMFRSNVAEAQTLSFTLLGTDPESYATVSALELPAGGQAQVNLTRGAIGSATLGEKSARLEVTAAPLGESVEIKLQHNIAAPLTSVAPSMVDFGSVPPETSRTRTFVIANPGTSTAEFSVRPSRITLPDGGTLRVEPSEISLGPNQSRSIDVRIVTKAGGFDDTYKLDVSAAGACDSFKQVLAHVLSKK